MNITKEQIDNHFEEHEKIEEHFSADTNLRDEFLTEIGYSLGGWSCDEINAQGVVYSAYHCGETDYVTMPWSYIFDREGWREQQAEKKRQKAKEDERKERERKALQEQKDRATLQLLKDKYEPQSSGRARRS